MMTAPSYLIANGATSPTGHPKTLTTHGGGLANGGTSNSSMIEQIQELSTPPPISMTLTATLQLLEPLGVQRDVFLMTRSYLRNWLVWAYHQKVSKVEASRVEAGVRLAAIRFGLEPPTNDMEYSDPGPIDGSLLSLEGHPLLLRPNVQAVDIDSKRKDDFTEIPDSLRRVKSLPNAGSTEKNSTMETIAEDLDEKGGEVLCCAVPERFYETLRAVHGVICNDGLSVSFQPYPRDSEELLHHHPSPSCAQKNGSSGQNGSHHVNGISDPRPRPIEFRRSVILEPEPVSIVSSVQDPTSPMTKLLEEEKKRFPRMVAKVELHPIKVIYSVEKTNDEETTTSGRGFVFVSQRTHLYQALHAMMKVAAPNTSVFCKRVWSKRQKGTASGDGFELVELDDVDNPTYKTNEKDKASEKEKIPNTLLGEWVRTHTCSSNSREIEVLIETKRSNSDWPRAALELENRIQVGDFVDAQDATGKWYEAIVREVTDKTVTVHYFGWASKWDSTVRRRRHLVTKKASSKISPPAPLWTHSSRWREKLAAGMTVEVRDASSRADRPKWYKGVVKKVASRREKLHDVVGGAELEKFEIPNTTTNGETDKKSLLLLNRNRQVFVEVEQERANCPAGRAAPREEDSVDTLEPQPPFLRWVNLYGEELCEAGTHMKIREKDKSVVTLRYEYDADRQPVEIMKSFNNMYGSGFMKESLHGTPPAPGSVGMHNLGNSCFLNSIVQCLNHIEPLTQYFTKGNYMHDLNRANPLGSGGRVATAYASLLREMWGGKFSALAPRMLKQTVASFAPQFNNSYQHDSQEFCQFLMDGLHEDCNRVKSKPYVEELEGFGMEDEKAAIETWRKHLLRHDSVIVDYFQGMHRSHLTCPSCGRESIKFDVFSTISLPLAQDKERNSADLYDCVDKFMEGEQLDELNAWYCPNCKKHVCALKMIALWSVPDILILHLKRFTFDHCSKSNQVVRSKIDDKVVFPIDGLDLRKHVLGPFDEAAPPIYNLFGVSEHQGATANSGHYTATVRNSKDGRWYRYNDAHVGETTGDAAVTGGAYVLFYKRAKGVSKWAGMESIMKNRQIDPYGGLETDQDGFTRVKTPKKKGKKKSS